MMPKFTILAVRRISEVTSAGWTAKTFAAVIVWMSASFWNASIIVASCERAAITRSSICE